MSVACPYPHAERCTFPPSRCLEKESVTPSLSSHRLSPLPVFTFEEWVERVARARVLAVLKKRVLRHPVLHSTVAFSTLETCFYGREVLFSSVVWNIDLNRFFYLCLNKFVPPPKSMSNLIFTCKLVIWYASRCFLIHEKHPHQEQQLSQLTLVI